MEHILTKDALYLLSYISNLPCGNMMSIAQMHENCKGFAKIFAIFMQKGRSRIRSAPHRLSPVTPRSASA